jgi:hypothetical protein
VNENFIVICLEEEEEEEAKHPSSRTHKKYQRRWTLNRACSDPPDSHIFLTINYRSRLSNATHNSLLYSRYLRTSRSFIGCRRTFHCRLICRWSWPSIYSIVHAIWIFISNNVTGRIEWTSCRRDTFRSRNIMNLNKKHWKIRHIQLNNKIQSISIEQDQEEDSRNNTTN